MKNKRSMKSWCGGIGNNEIVFRVRLLISVHVLYIGRYSRLIQQLGDHQ